MAISFIDGKRFDRNNKNVNFFLLKNVQKTLNTTRC